MSLWQEYRALLGLRGAKSLLLLSLLVRGINIPIGAIITVIAYELSGSWGMAALAGGIAAGSSALAIWISGKAMDLWSPRLILILFIPGGLVPLIFLADPQGWWLLAASFLLGVSRPPTGTTIRTSWQRIAQDEQTRLVAYGLESSLVPISGAAGALVAGVLAGLFGVSSLIVFLVVMATISAVMLAFHSSTSDQGARGGFSISELWPGSDDNNSLPPLGLSIWITIGMVALSWGALVGLEILVGDRFGPEVLLFVTALGGLSVALGALGNIRARDRSGRRSLVLAALLAAISLVWITTAFWLDPLIAFPAVIAFGVARGLISASGSTYLSITSPETRRSEALALYGSGVLAGQAIYRPLAGILLVAAPALILLLPGALFVALAMSLHQKRIEAY